MLREYGGAEENLEEEKSKFQIDGEYNLTTRVELLATLTTWRLTIIQHAAGETRPPTQRIGFNPIS